MQRIAKRIALSLAVLLLAVPAVEASQWGGCVRYVRDRTGISIFADAWGWWDGAAGRFERGSEPAVGAIMVFRRGDTLRLGHVSLVSRIVDSRTVLVDHNWGRAGIIRNHRVIDTSPNNDWSTVRVWHNPSDTPGIYNYRLSGFVYPDTVPPPVAQSTVASSANRIGQVEEGRLETGRQVWNQRGAIAQNPAGELLPSVPMLAIGPAPASANGQIRAAAAARPAARSAAPAVARAVPRPARSPARSAIGAAPSEFAEADTPVPRRRPIDAGPRSAR